MTLLEKINENIAKYGGREKLANAIECEWIKIPKYKKVPCLNYMIDNAIKWNDKDVKIVIEMQPTHKYKVIAKRLKRTKCSVGALIWRLTKKGVLSYKYAVKV